MVGRNCLTSLRTQIAGAVKVQVAAAVARKFAEARHFPIVIQALRVCIKPSASFESAVQFRHDLSCLRNTPGLPGCHLPDWLKGQFREKKNQLPEISADTISCQSRTNSRVG